MLSKKKTILLLSLGIGAATAVLTTNIYFGSRSILKHIKIANKNDTNQITPEEFKEQWENEGLSFNSPIFQKYFNLEFKHAKANNVLKHLEFSNLKADNNAQTLKFKLTYKKGYGKDENKEITLSNFSEHEINTLKFDLSDNVKNNAVNILASAVNKDISSFKIESNNKNFNQDDYKFTVETNPNDITGKLYAQITVASKSDTSISKVFTLDNLTTQFKVYKSNEQINNASINYSRAKNEIKEKDLYSAQAIVEYLKNNPSYALTNLISYDDSNMTDKPLFKREYFTAEKNTISLEYWILTPKNNPSKFSDNNILGNAITKKKITLDFSQVIKEAIDEDLKDKFDFDFNGTADDKKYIQASKIKNENIKSTLDVYNSFTIDYSFTHPNDETGEVTVIGSVKNKTTGKVLLTKTKKIWGFSKERERLQAAYFAFIANKLEFKDDLSSALYFDEIEKEYNDTCESWWNSHDKNSLNMHNEYLESPSWNLYKKYFKNIHSLIKDENIKYSTDGIKYIPMQINKTVFSLKDTPYLEQVSLFDYYSKFYLFSKTIIDKNDDGTYVYKNISYENGFSTDLQYHNDSLAFKSLLQLQLKNIKKDMQAILEDAMNFVTNEIDSSGAGTVAGEYLDIHDRVNKIIWEKFSNHNTKWKYFKLYFDDKKVFNVKNYKGDQCIYGYELTLLLYTYDLISLNVEEKLEGAVIKKYILKAQDYNLKESNTRIFKMW